MAVWIITALFFASIITAFIAGRSSARIDD
jgi:hypothetical protein